MTRRRLPLTLILALCLAPVPTSAARGAEPARITLPAGQAGAIGRSIWRNEAGGRVDGLTAWNEGEAFPSLGIGHFIWYPAGKRGPFKERFPELLATLRAKGVRLPPWLDGADACPWPTREAFRADFSGPRLKALRKLLAETVDLQAEFLAARLVEALPALLAGAAGPAERRKIAANFERVAKSPGGWYALVDYVNFKGEGLLATERYGGTGWGLLQVLLDMPDSCGGRTPGPPTDPANAGAGQPADALWEFSAAADRVLTRRVATAPRDETRWLAGWRNRVRTYRTPR